MVSITEVRPGAPTAIIGPMLGAVLGAVADQLASILRGLDVADVSGAEAAEVTEAFARVERLGMAGKTLAAGRVAESGYSRQAGFPSPRAWLAHATKASPWEAAKTIQTGAHLAADHLSATRDALVSGRLTATQANELAITSAGKPGEQERLLDLAERETTEQLKAECRKVRLADKPADDPQARRRRVMEETGFGHRSVGGDMSELFARMPTSVMAMVLAAVRHQCDAVFARARAEGRDDPTRPTWSRPWSPCCSSDRSTAAVARATMPAPARSTTPVPTAMPTAPMHSQGRMSDTAGTTLSNPVMVMVTVPMPALVPMQVPVMVPMEVVVPVQALQGPFVATAATLARGPTTRGGGCLTTTYTTSCWPRSEESRRRHGHPGGNGGPDSGGGAGAGGG